MSSDPNWILGYILGGAGFIATVIGGVIARDRQMSRQIRDGDEKLHDQMRDGEDKLHDRLSRIREDLTRELAQLRQEFTTYKLEVAREYASQTHLKDVEERLTRAIEKVESTLEHMPKALAKEIVQSMKASKMD